MLCITNNSIKHESFVYTQLNDRIVLFQTIQFSIITQFSSIWLIERTLSDATTPSKSGSRSDGNEEVLHILQSYSITEASPSDCLVSYPGHSLEEPYPSAEMRSVCSIVAAGWAIGNMCISKVKLVTVVKGKPKAPFSIATTPSCRERRYSNPWIGPLYPWYESYNAECYARRLEVPFFSLWYDDLGLNPRLPNQWWTLYPLNQMATHCSVFIVNETNIFLMIYPCLNSGRHIECWLLKYFHSTLKYWRLFDFLVLNM